ncbi:hypothetical protein GSI_01513 [Ganoderma sinense ZZ0214-1]|uniref:Uncharacterized protein n=1 Tax=Ganoderma sinense ZZ0214-1 TaxID=1077348 RepID=A0A2G8SQ60_9APHY|nr:hypothetical protein GSI_01513 [Ganoderma sinense ZZ0214-1]
MTTKIAAHDTFFYGAPLGLVPELADMSMRHVTNLSAAKSNVCDDFRPHFLPTKTTVPGVFFYALPFPPGLVPEWAEMFMLSVTNLSAANEPVRCLPREGPSKKRHRDGSVVDDAS